MDVTDPLLNSLIFISYCYCEKAYGEEFNRGNSEPCCESDQITISKVKLWTTLVFIKVHFQQKSMTKLFKIKKKKTYFGVTFAQRDFFPIKTLAVYNCRGPTEFECQTKHFCITINIQKPFNQSPQFIKSFVRYTWFKNLLIYRASPIFG